MTFSLRKSVPLCKDCAKVVGALALGMTLALSLTGCSSTQLTSTETALYNLAVAADKITCKVSVGLAAAGNAQAASGAKVSTVEQTLLVDSVAACAGLGGVVAQ